MLFATGIIIIPVLLSPMPRFRAPLSTVVEAGDGTLLGARIADDGQWRFPPSDSVPYKFEKALLTFEDRYFYYHPGVNPVSVFRALINNIRAHEIVSGGSTITMQVARLSRGNRPRTFPEKMVEVLGALKMELFRSKKAILRLYVANAPFGGNNVGLEAASWRYTGKPSFENTWAEAAALAVLPNAPGLIYPGRNQVTLKLKRDDLLRRLHQRKLIDSLTLLLALEEPLPGEPKPIPSKAPHLTDLFYLKNHGGRIRTTIISTLQERTTDIINAHQKDLAGNFIFNSAALIVDVESGKVLAYVGNSSATGVEGHGAKVDIIRSPRSTGSILKPILYAGMQQSGEILPNTLVADFPTRFPGFTPKNFDQSFSGAVPAASALSQSLNIPSVRLLQQYSPERFLGLLKQTGFTSFNKTADHYGLSLILGGGEASLWELTGVYASLSRVLKRFNNEGKYIKEDYHPPVLLSENETGELTTVDKDPILGAASIWLTYEALQKVNRPETETGWQYFESANDLAWKTGTSFGFRDAWAIGTTPGYVIGVWAGNANGEGRPGLTGTSAAAPILFDIAGIMRSLPWFKPPFEDMTTIPVCSSSGYRAGPDCPVTREESICLNGLRSEVCPYHRMIHLNRSRTCQVTVDCVAPTEIINEPWFVLPPAMEYFYRQKHPEYKILPPFAPGCGNEKSEPVMEFIYPANGTKIFIPRDHTGELTRVIPEVVHRNPSKKIFWHLDGEYIGTTKFIHRTEILGGTGNHTITVVDEDGNSIKCSFTITGRN